MTTLQRATDPTDAIEGVVRPARDHHPLESWPDTTSVIALIEDRVERQPERIALKAGNDAVSYGTFNRQANSVAHQLIAEHPGRHPLVPLVMEHAACKAIAVVGVLKAGLAYAMLNTSLDDGGLGDLLDHTDAPLVVTDRENLERVHRLATASTRVLVIDELLDAGPFHNPGVPTTPQTLSSVSFTSGSTGKPKGVARNLGHEFLCMRGFYNTARFGPGDTVALLHNMWFTHVLAPLVAGASLALYDMRHGNFTAMAAWLRNESIGHYGGMATGFLQFLQTLRPGEFFPALRVVELTGEPVRAEDLARMARAVPDDCMLITSYTSSEQARIAHFVISPSEHLAPGQTLPVGHAAEEIELALLDDDLAEVAEGDIGEIAIASAYPSPGYWDDPERTARTWVRHPGDGRVLYLSGDMGRRDAMGRLFLVGRKDDQIKIRGRLFFNTEVEAAINALPGIVRSAVVTFSGEVTDERFACFFVPEAGMAPEPSAMRTALSRHLPAHKIPNAFVALEAMPLTDSGKINRRELPRDSLVAWTGETEPAAQVHDRVQKIIDAIAIAGKLLHCRADCSFIDCGGDSLAALEVALAIERQFEVTIDPEDLLEHQPIGAVALDIVQRSQARAAGVAG